MNENFAIQSPLLKGYCTLGVATGMLEALSKKCRMEPLEQVQRVCLLEIMGAMKTTATKALEIILDIRPIHIQVRYEATLTVSRLMI